MSRSEIPNRPGDLEGLQRRLRVARGELPPDLVLRGGQVVDVFTGTLQTADVAFCDGLIAGVGDYDGPAVEVRGRFVSPGCIDGHLHLESTMLTPPEFCRAVVPRGTMAVVADPHEIANVLGPRGLDYMLAASGDLPVEIFFMLPSCVPATHLETAGAHLGVRELELFRGHPRVLGLAEVMNVPGVLGGDPEVLGKLLLFGDRRIDGHAPLLRGRGLNAYRLAGMASDHECTTLAEAQEKLVRGFYLMMREGSQAKNLRDLLPAATPAARRRCLLVTDDCHPCDLAEAGHVDQLLRRAVAEGLDPVSALTMVTLNPAEYFGLRDRGALAPGFRADVVVWEDLTEFRAAQVYKHGVLVAEAGECVADLSREAVPPPEGTFRVRGLSPESFRLAAAGEMAKVIGLVPGQLLTTKLVRPTPVRGREVASDPEQDILKLAVVERHRGTGNVGLGLVQGFGLRQGALASSVAHDSHNIVVVGVDEADMQVAVERLIALGGGLVVAAGGAVHAEVPLPVAGLMSPEPLAMVAGRHRRATAAARELGCRLDDPFMALSFLALPVIPELKLTDEGLVDVNRFQIVPLFGED